MKLTRLFTFLAPIVCVSCQVLTPPALTRLPDVDATAGPSGPPEVRWKERMGQGYLFLEQRGDYRDLGQAMSALAEACSEESGVQPIGSPFLLLYDDPGEVPVNELRSRVCLPVGSRPTGELNGALAFDVLPSSLVVYAQVEARASEAMQTVPDLLESMRTLGGRPSGPVREILLPASSPGARPRTEVQIPWIPAGS